MWVQDDVEYRLLPCQGSPCLWTVVPIRPGEDPSVKTSKDELTRGVVITYVDDLLLTGWQHHIDAITKALLAKYVMKKSGSLPEERPEKGKSTSEGIDFLGARITRDDDGTVWCDQSKYILHCMRENEFMNKEGQAALASTGKYPLGQNPSLFAPESFQKFSAPLAFQETSSIPGTKVCPSCIVCTNAAESGITIPNVGLVISSGVQRRVSTDIRTGSTVNAFQTLSKTQLLQQLGRSGRTDCGVHITMMSHEQYLSQVRSSDQAQLEESDISPMILRSLVAPPCTLVVTKISLAGKGVDVALPLGTSS